MHPELNSASEEAPQRREAREVSSMFFKTSHPLLPSNSGSAPLIINILPLCSSPKNSLNFTLWVILLKNHTTESKMDGCTTLWMYLTPLNCALKNGQNGKSFAIFILPKFNKAEERRPEEKKVTRGWYSYLQMIEEGYSQ